MSYITKCAFLCYILIAVGQLWLYSLNLRSEGLYERVTLQTGEWIGSHALLLLGALLIFPATMVVKKYLANSNRYLVWIAVVLTCLGAISLIGQFMLDFYLIPEFKGQTSDAAYAALEGIQSNGLIKFFCYDLIAAWLLGQVLFIIALARRKSYPKWALVLFILGLCMLIFGDSIHQLIERLSYVLFSIAIWPAFRR